MTTPIQDSEMPLFVFATVAVPNSVANVNGEPPRIWLASHSYLFIAVGRDDQPFDMGPNAPSTTADGCLVQVMDVKVSTEGVDWAIARNADRDRPYYRHVRTDRIAYMGHSCGGMQALTLDQQVAAYFPAEPAGGPAVPAAPTR